MESDSLAFICNTISQDMEIYRTISNIVGAIYIAKVTITFLYKFIKYTSFHVMCRLSGLKNLTKLYGPWAVVTGGTDGIGLAYANELAKRGMNIVLVSRTSDRLKSVAGEIGSKFGVQTEVVVADFNKGYEAYAELRKFIDQLDVGILVNNVGVISEAPMNFIEMTEDSIKEHINVNIIPCTIITRIVLPQMVRRKRGAIVNMSSIAGLHPTPLFSVYSGTKVYMDYLSQALEYECSDSNIRVQTLLPWFVNTKMIQYSKQLKQSWFVPNADKYAKHAVRTLGLSERTSGYWLHDFIASVTSSTPRWLYKFLSVKALNRLSKASVK